MPKLDLPSVGRGVHDIYKIPATQISEKREAEECFLFFSKVQFAAVNERTSHENEVERECSFPAPIETTNWRVHTSEPVTTTIAIVTRRLD